MTWLLFALWLLLAGSAWMGWWLVQTDQLESENDRRLLAEKAYEELRFADAAHAFYKLQGDYPHSQHLAAYRFLADLSTSRDFAYARPEEPGETMRALERLLKFVAENRRHPLFKKYQGDVGATFVKLAEELTGWAERNHEADLLTQTRVALQAAGQLALPPLAASRKRQLENGLIMVQKGIEDWIQRRDILAVLAGLKKSSGNVVERALALVRREARDRPELIKDEEILKLLAELPAVQLAGVKYVHSGERRPPPAGEENMPSLLVTRPVREEPAPVTDANPPVFALARGVLYALEPKRGEPRWARRVGQETTQLPQALPATATLPARLLILASGRNTLSLVAADSGQILWEHALSGPCWGQPLLIDGRALLALGNGRIEEIDLNSGRLLGWYDVGQPLTGYGVWQAGTRLAYFPADSFCIYALDLDRRNCAGLSYTGHPPGTLRGPPLLFSASFDPGKQGSLPSGVLVLTQAETLNRVRLREVAIPFPPARTPPLAETAGTSCLPDAQQPRGWSWTGPYPQGDRLVLVTDAGHLSVYGVRKAGSRDGPLYQQVTTTVLTRQAGGGIPAQVLQARGDSFWVLVNGQLHRYEMSLFPDRGLDLRLRWQRNDFLGTPLHAVQSRPLEMDPLFYLTTEIGNTRQVLALDSGNGVTHWQRKLGLIPAGPPMRVGERLVVLDQDGDVLVLDPSRWPADQAPAWLEGANLTVGRLASPGQPLHVFPRPGSKSLTVLYASSAASEGELVLADLQVAGEVKSVLHHLKLGEALRGTPALGPAALVAPLADGTLARHTLPSTAPAAGPRWRAVHADADAIGHVLWIEGDEYLVTDGSRGLIRLRWREGQMADQRQRLELPARLSTAPLLLPATKDQPARVVVTTADGTVTLLRVDTLELLRRWHLKGNLTAGPAVRGQGVVCVIDQRRLIWLNPDRTEPLWEYASPSRIVGVPEEFAGELLVADLAGWFVPLSTRTGPFRREPFQLRANVVAATTPVPWRPGQWLVPLTDGTMMVVGRR